MGRPVAMVAADGTITFFHQDKSGSVIAMSDTSGNLTEGPYAYDAYGNCVSGGAACSGGVPYKYTGRRLDPETGLYYYRARYYSSAIGRFLQTDHVRPASVPWSARHALLGKIDPAEKTCPEERKQDKSWKIIPKNVEKVRQGRLTY